MDCASRQRRFSDRGSTRRGELVSAARRNQLSSTKGNQENEDRKSHTTESVSCRENLTENTMTKSILGVACAAVLLVGFAHAQTSSPDPKAGAEMTGTIKEYTPGSVLVLETLAPSEPVQFKLSKNVTYADADGKVIETAGLTTNQKVRVHYTKVGGDNVADKVTLIGN